MLHAAQLGALATVGSRLFHLGPEFTQKARHGVALDAKGRHPPAVDHVVRGGHKADLLAHGQHQRVVDFQQVVFALGLHAVDLRARRGQAAGKLHAFGRVLVQPQPLAAGDLDDQIGFIARVFVVQHRVVGRNAEHTIVNGQQGRKRQQHEKPLLARLGRYKVGRHMAARLAVVDQPIHHDGQHAEEDHQNDDHEQVVHVQRLARYRRHRLGEIEVVVGQRGG